MLVFVAVTMLLDLMVDNIGYYRLLLLVILLRMKSRRVNGVNGGRLANIKSVTLKWIVFVWGLIDILLNYSFFGFCGFYGDLIF